MSDAQRAAEARVKASAYNGGSDPYASYNYNAPERRRYEEKEKMKSDRKAEDVGAIFGGHDKSERAEEATPRQYSTTVPIVKSRKAEDVRAIFGGRDGAKREEGDAYAEYQRGLMDKADALYKERQGAMKWKPPVYTSMLLSNNGFIGEQGNERYKDIKFGPKGNVNQNGCGAIAVQNMNLMLGKKSNFIDVVNQFNQDSDESTILGGIVGGNPKYLKSIYEDQGYQVKEVRRAEELPKDGSKFMLLSFYKDPIGAHYEAAEWTDTGKLRVYNTSSAQNGLAYMEFDDLQAYQKKVGSQDKDRYSRTNYIAIK